MREIKRKTWKMKIGHPQKNTGSKYFWQPALVAEWSKALSWLLRSLGFFYSHVDETLQLSHGQNIDLCIIPILYVLATLVIACLWFCCMLNILCFLSFVSLVQPLSKIPSIDMKCIGMDNLSTGLQWNVTPLLGNFGGRVGIYIFL